MAAFFEARSRGCDAKAAFCHAKNRLSTMMRAGYNSALALTAPPAAQAGSPLSRHEIPRWALIDPESPKLATVYNPRPDAAGIPVLLLPGEEPIL